MDAVDSAQSDENDGELVVAGARGKKGEQEGDGGKEDSNA
jgi:hypothetical protein